MAHLQLARLRQEHEQLRAVRSVPEQPLEQEQAQEVQHHHVLVAHVHELQERHVRVQELLVYEDDLPLCERSCVNYTR